MGRSAGGDRVEIASTPMRQTLGMATPGTGSISLPAVDDGTLHALLRSRRSTKNFANRAVSLPELASLLTAAAGETGSGHRAIPSARASYPVSVTVIAGRVDGLDAGAYRYDPGTQHLVGVVPGDHRPSLAGVTLDADWMADCPLLLLLSADLRGARSRFTDQPPEHGERFVWLEAGCMAQNVYLWAGEHRLGAVLIAGLDDARACEATAGLLPHGHDLLGILPVGHPVSTS
ncbi:SagB/ThcOx family dehydrogenase [Flexivirga sp.]|uniref:SagB/ThcOx family dehydrogenase n=1 Tax=Flexivirga sp. TaxID=1962927 RepID=UPI002D7F62F3|nr:SagB/ThcOx family dehydrogenase [Flexivirga sp.]